MSKQTPSLLSRMKPHVLVLGVLSVAASFAVGIQTTGDVQPIELIEAGSTSVSGDVDMNGSVDVQDAVLILEIVQGYRQATYEQLRVDPNEDGHFTVDDALRILSTLPQ